MDEKDLKSIENLLDKKLDQKLNQALEPIKNDLTEIKESVDSNTASFTNLEKEIGIYKDALDIERERIDKHDERLEVVEESLG